MNFVFHEWYRFEAWVDLSLTARQIFEIIFPSPEKWIFVILNKRAKFFVYQQISQDRNGNSKIPPAVKLILP